MMIHPRFSNFPPYKPIEPVDVLSRRLGFGPEEIVKLDANENPYGPSPRARAALADLRWANLYPDPESRVLRAGLADFAGAPFENLMAGAGADELIDLLLRVLLEPGDRVVVCPPTFGMYAFDTRLNTGQVLDVPRRDDFTIDIQAVQEAVIRERPKVLFLSTPNNPDGSLPDARVLDALLDLPTLVVLDEAYIEFCDTGGRLGERISRIGQVAQRDNLVVLRTFSKWAGLAGLRVGYGAFPSWLMPVLWQAKQPYNVNVAASAAALASLEDAGWLAEQVAAIRQERGRLFTRLSAVPELAPRPSQGNFILAAVQDGRAAQRKEVLAARGILIRYYDTPLLRDCIRVSVGRPQDTDALLKALEEMG